MAKKKDNTKEETKTEDPKAVAVPAIPNLEAVEKFLKVAGLTAAGLSQAGGSIDRLIQSRVEPFRQQVWRYGLFFIITVLIGYGLNLAGAKEINIIFLLLLNLVIPMEATRPNWLTKIAYAGALYGAIKNNAALEGAENLLLKRYSLVILNIQLYGSLIFFFLGTIPMKESPFAFFIGIAALILIFQIKPVWEFPGKLGKRLIYAYVIAILIISIWSLIPGTFWIDKVGVNLNPTELFSVSEDKEQVIKAKEALRKNAIEDNANNAKFLLKKIEDEKLTILSPEQGQALLAAEKEAEKNSASGKLKNLFSKEPQWETLAIKKLFLNVYTSETWGFQYVATVKPDVLGNRIIRVDAEGIYQQAFQRDNGTLYWKNINIKSGMHWRAYYQDKLPLPDHWLGCGVVLVGEKVYPLGAEIEITAPTDIYFSINMPMEYNDKGSGSPEENFKFNRGTVDVYIMAKDLLM